MKLYDAIILLSAFFWGGIWSYFGPFFVIAALGPIPEASVAGVVGWIWGAVCFYKLAPEVRMFNDGA